MNFNLQDNEIKFLLQVLGELPSRTGAFILLQNLENQYKQLTNNVGTSPNQTEVNVVEE